MLLLLYRGNEVNLPCDGANINDGGNALLLDFNDDATVDLGTLEGPLLKKTASR